MVTSSPSEMPSSNISPSQPDNSREQNINSLESFGDEIPAAGNNMSPGAIVVLACACIAAVVVVVLVARKNHQGSSSSSSLMAVREVESQVLPIVDGNDYSFRNPIEVVVKEN